MSEWYNVGTVTWTNNSDIVNGTGVAWLTNKVRGGDAIRRPDNVFVEIAEVLDNDSLRLRANYEGPTLNLQAYTILPTASRSIDALEYAVELLGSFGVVRDGIGAGLFPDGSAATPAFRFVNDQDTGFYRAGNNILGIATGGVGRVFFNDNGVGIGTSNPGGKLEVNGDFRLITPSGQAFTHLIGAIAGISNGHEIVTDASNNRTYRWRRGDNVTCMEVAPNGNVGIGSTSPNSLLNLRKDSAAGTIAATPSLVISNQTSTSGTYLAGGIFANTYRDITAEHIPAGIWFQRQNDPVSGAAATQCSVIIGTGATSVGLSLPSARLIVTPSGQVLPGADNSQPLGSASERWSVLFAQSGAINTSDEREKHWRGELNAAELRAAKRIIAELGIYQWNDAVAEKGEDGARLHFGVRAQRAFQIMDEEGLDWGRYAWACYDQWEEQTEPVMAEVTVTKTRKVMRPSTLIDPATGQPAMVEVDEAYEETEMQPTGETRVTLEAGDRYGVRPDQLAFWLIAAQAAMQAELERSIAILEARLASLEAA